MKRSCQLTLQAQSPACEIWMCEDCGNIVLNIGPMSLRLQQDHFINAVVTMQKVVNRLMPEKPETDIDFSACTYQKVHH